jgi:hypothetical protein
MNSDSDQFSSKISLIMIVFERERVLMNESKRMNKESC